MKIPYMLILGCSQTKRPDPLPLDAIDRYNGPLFRVLRSALKGWPELRRDVDVFVLSAKHGLIPGRNVPIENYDQRMTPERARELELWVSAGVISHFETYDYQEILICAGKVYHLALATALERLPESRVTRTTGGIGEQAGQLKDWLWRRSGL